MSLQAIQVQDYIERIAKIYEANITLFPTETSGQNLITKVIRNRPAIEQSSQDGVIPYIIVFESTQPIRFLEKAGRDTRNAEGGSVYEVEIYSVAITNNEISATTSQASLNVILQAMRDSLSKNLRLALPVSFTEPLCRTHSRFEIPYTLRGDVPATMFAKNIVVRPQVYVSPRV